MAANEGLGKFLAEFMSSKRTVAPTKWTTIRVFLSSTFIDTHGERDILMKRVFPNINRHLAKHRIRVVGVDLRWGVLDEESKDCKAIQKTCLNQVDACRDVDGETAWFIGLRTQRYGWVQEEYANPEDFRKPEHFQWLEKLQESANHVSITSLECLHSVLGASIRSMKPKMLIYERKLANPEDVEPLYSWIFQHENILDNTHVDESLKLQYNQTPHAGRYQNDREALNDFLKSQHGIMTTYREYSCSYEPGNNEITATRPNGKMFGVGRVGDLEEFAKQVENDLFESIMANVGPTQPLDMSDVEKENLPFQQVMEEKALTFIGRENLLKVCMRFCEAELKDKRQNSDENDDEGVANKKKLSSNLLIIHGEPGCGKSALTAALSYTEYIQQLRRDGHFVFTHAVDTCPGSTNLAVMLRRLHRNLKDFRKKSDNTNHNKTSKDTESEHENRGENQSEIGTEEDDEYKTQSLVNLKENHIKYLELISRENPHKLFIVVIDAVNQMSSHFNSHFMWWVRLRDPPSNLRVIISTLNNENNTFANAATMCPNAYKILVPHMDEADARLMVTNILNKYNKKLTTTSENKDLGNQLSLLISKSTSPLYLTAATEALRTFGIFEKLSDYIQKLPSDIFSLFKQLLKEWEVVHGYKFVQDVCSILCVSRGGILENTMNSVLLLIEEVERFQYNCSFSRFYDFIKGFLAASGGSNLRFFHDQLKQVVRKKYLPTESENNRIHRFLSKFYVQEISLQLYESPFTSPPAEYESFLSEVVYHQIQSNGEDVDEDPLFESSLQNIYFIRERCAAGQCDDLLHDYVSAIQRTKDTYQAKALRSWQRFTQCYIVKYLPYIEYYGISSFSHYNIATQQPTTSLLNRDILKLPPPPSRECELIWTNPPTTTNNTVTYNDTQCYCCTVSVVEDQKLLLVGGRSQCWWLYDLDTGVTLQSHVSGSEYDSDSDISITAVHICPTTKTIWFGDESGYVRVFSIDTGDQLWEESVVGSGEVKWFCNVGDKVLVFAGESSWRYSATVAAFECGVNYKRVDFWLTEPTAGCVYNPVTEIVMTGHEGGVIKMWWKDGNLLKQFQVQGEVESLSANPQDIFVVAIGIYNGGIVIYNIANEKEVLTIPNVSIFPHVTYDNEGEKLFALSGDERSVLIFNTDGELLNTLSCNIDLLRDMSVVPGTGDVVIVDTRGCKLIECPATPDIPAECESEENTGDAFIKYCGMLAGGKEYFTFSWSIGWLGILRVFSVDTSQRIRERKEKEWHIGGAVAHPMKQSIFVWNPNGKVLIIDAFLLRTLSIVDFRKHVYVSIAPDGTKCTVTHKTGVAVYNIVCTNVMDERTSPPQEKYQLINTGKKYTTECISSCIQSTEIHKDNVHVVYRCEGGCAGIWDTNTGKIWTIAAESDVRQIKFVYAPIEGVMYLEKGIHLITMDGSPVWSNECKENICLHSDEYFLSYGQGITVHSMENGNVVYSFIDHRIKSIAGLLKLPQGLLACDCDGSRYKFILKMCETLHS